MKFFVAALALMISGVSFAEVKPPGTFVPSLCSEKAEERTATVISVESVCLGSVVAGEKNVLRLHLTDGTDRDYAIQIERKPGGMGVTTKKFSGNVMTIRMMDPVSGALRTTSGITVTHDISLKTETTGLEFSGSLQQVFVTQ